MHDTIDSLDHVILRLQEETGWLSAVRVLTSLSCTQSITTHIYLPQVNQDLSELPLAYCGFCKRALGVFHFIACHEPNIARLYGENPYFLRALFNLIADRRCNIYVEAALVLEDVGRKVDQIHNKEYI